MSFIRFINYWGKMGGFLKKSTKSSVFRLISGQKRCFLRSQFEKALKYELKMFNFKAFLCC